VRAALAGVREEADGRSGVHEDQVVEAGERLDGLVGAVGHALDGHATAAALDVRDPKLGHDRRAGGFCRTPCQRERVGVARAAANENHARPPWSRSARAAASTALDSTAALREQGGHSPRRRLIPRRVRRQDQRRDLPGVVRAARTASAASCPTFFALTLMRTHAETVRASARCPR
jgi:hypothetical protein